MIISTDLDKKKNEEGIDRRSNSRATHPIPMQIPAELRHLHQNLLKRPLDIIAQITQRSRFDLVDRRVPKRTLRVRRRRVDNGDTVDQAQQIQRAEFSRVFVEVEQGRLLDNGDIPFVAEGVHGGVELVRGFPVLAVGFEGEVGVAA